MQNDSIALCILGQFFIWSRPKYVFGCLAIYQALCLQWGYRVYVPWLTVGQQRISEVRAAPVAKCQMRRKLRKLMLSWLRFYCFKLSYSKYLSLKKENMLRLWAIMLEQNSLIKIRLCRLLHLSWQETQFNRSQLTRRRVIVWPHLLQWWCSTLHQKFHQSLTILVIYNKFYFTNCFYQCCCISRVFDCWKRKEKNNIFLCSSVCLSFQSYGLAC